MDSTTWNYSVIIHYALVRSRCATPIPKSGVGLNSLEFMIAYLHTHIYQIVNIIFIVYMVYLIVGLNK